MVKITTKIHYGEEDFQKIMQRLINEKIEMLTMQLENGEYKQCNTSSDNYEECQE
ncbi:hypothetical protein [Inconstantimicrobium mannanitabidum]|uniref:Uncharacterized protein n=1 Tax=Inconstantimicrobium mannanitabidum TaxID=1604901 RepID=A0ACB5R6D3_9CLOT|nr:hypothetical protein [Clostridium sp. TW13]GKX64797.1 hypothetical protein rsdtw13_00550 [Clostridium sp. TW13]